MQARLSLNWMAIALRGVVAIIFGVIAFLVPAIALVSLILLFAAFAIVSGASHVVTGFRQPSGGPDWLMIAGGVAAVAIGVLSAILPGITALFLVTLIGTWAILTGASEIVAAWKLRKEISGELLLALNGVISVIFGLYLWVFPGAGAIALIWLIAAFAIVSGVMLVLFAFRLRSLANRGGGLRTGSPTASA